MSYEKIVVGETAARVKELERLSSAEYAGKHRDVAVKALAGLKSKHAFTVPYGRGVCEFSGEGVLTREPATSEAEEKAVYGRFYIAPQLSDLLLAGAAPLNKIVDGMVVPFGVCAIVGGTGVGKTPLAHALAAAGVDSYCVVRAGEPFAGYDLAQKTIAREIGLAALTSKDVVVDSIKDLLSGGGSLMKGGISRDALIELSAWSILGATIGVTFYVPINPSDNSKELVEMVATSALASSTMMIANTGNGWTYSARRGEGMQRVDGKHNFAAAYPEDDVPQMRVAVGSDTDISSTLAGVIHRNRNF